MKTNKFRSSFNIDKRKWYESNCNVYKLQHGTKDT